MRNLKLSLSHAQIALEMGAIATFCFTVPALAQEAEACAVTPRVAPSENHQWVNHEPLGFAFQVPENYAIDQEFGFHSGKTWTLIQHPATADPNNCCFDPFHPNCPNMDVPIAVLTYPWIRPDRDNITENLRIALSQVDEIFLPLELDPEKVQCEPIAIAAQPALDCYTIHPDDPQAFRTVAIAHPDNSLIVVDMFTQERAFLADEIAVFEHILASFQLTQSTEPDRNP